MTAIVILNIVFSAFVVIGILALLGWGIMSDRAIAGRLRTRRRTAVRASRPAPARLGPAQTAR